MADIKCRVCGEPWDTHHLRYDAPAWVMPLVLAGAGCESCEGIAPEGADHDAIAYESDRSLVFDSAIDTDPLTERPAIAGETPPKWARPADTVEWECAGCGLQIRRNPDYREGYDSGDGYGAAHEIFMPGRSLTYREEKCLTGQAGTYEELINENSIDGTHCRLCVSECGHPSCHALVAHTDCDVPHGFPDPRDPYRGALLCEEHWSDAEYECAVESYSDRDLIEALGYDRRSHVARWVDSRGVPFEVAHATGLVEIEGDGVRYERAIKREVDPRTGGVTLTRDRSFLARALWTIRREVRNSEA